MTKPFITFNVKSLTLHCITELSNNMLQLKISLLLVKMHTKRLIIFERNIQNCKRTRAMPQENLPYMNMKFHNSTIPQEIEPNCPKKEQIYPNACMLF